MIARRRERESPTALTLRQIAAHRVRIAALDTHYVRLGAENGRVRRYRGVAFLNIDPQTDRFSGEQLPEFAPLVARGFEHIRAGCGDFKRVPERIENGGVH
jgi:hypothetical protein